MFGNLSYLIYSILFGGLITLILVITYKDLFKKNLAILAKVLILLIPVSIFVDTNAVRTGTWFYADDKIIGFGFIDSPIETSLFFGAIVTIGVCMLTFIFLDLEKKKANRETWIRTILGISSLGLVTSALMLLLRVVMNYP